MDGRKVEGGMEGEMEGEKEGDGKDGGREGESRKKDSVIIVVSIIWLSLLSTCTSNDCNALSGKCRSGGGKKRLYGRKALVTIKKKKINLDMVRL